MANVLEYIKTIWKAGRAGGTAWTPDRLNNIEGGIEQATKQINTNSADIETIGKEIGEINSNLDNISSVVDIYTHTFYVSKQGHVVQIQNAAYESSISFTKNETKLVATLPDECKPPWDIFFPITSLTIPSYVCLVVKTNGQVVLMNLSGSSVTISRWLASSYSYIVTS